MEHAHHDHHTHDYVAANKEFFDENVHKYDDPRGIELAHRQLAAIKRIYPALLNEEQTTVLDFACGAGK